MKISEKFYNLLKHKGYNYAKLAESYGYSGSPQNLSQIGKRIVKDPTFRQLISVSRLIDLTIEELIEYLVDEDDDKFSKILKKAPLKASLVTQNKKELSAEQFMALSREDREQYLEFLKLTKRA